LYSIDVLALKPPTSVPCAHDNIEVELTHAYGGSALDDIDPNSLQGFDSNSPDVREIALHRARLCAPRKLFHFHFIFL
jgi:hypothetical protein